MIRFDIPKNLNGFELVEELETAGVTVIEEDGRKAPVIDTQGLWLNIAQSDEAKAKPIVAAHSGTMVAPEPTINDKLASVGLSVDELKAALGL
jgi:hypothetical protein